MNVVPSPLPAAGMKGDFVIKLLIQYCGIASHTRESWNPIQQLNGRRTSILNRLLEFKNNTIATWYIFGIILVYYEFRI